MKILKSLLGTLALTSCLASGYSQSFLTNGLIAHYLFNGNANDASGNGNNAVASTNVSFGRDRFGTSSAAAQFSGELGTNSAIDCPTLDNIPYFPITYSSWFKLDQYAVASGELMTLVGREQSDLPGNEGAIALASVQGQGLTNNMAYSAGGGPLIGFPTFSPVTNQWYQCVLTIDASGAVSLYISGTLVSTQQASTQSLAGVSPLPFRIGASTLYYGTINSGAPRYCWAGAIDDVRIYNRALSASEIQQLYVLESGPRIKLLKAVKPAFSNLSLGTNYQLQVSTDLSTWTNYGPAFPATNIIQSYPQYFEVGDFGELFFRLQVTP